MQVKTNGQECSCGDLGFNFNLAVESASCHPSQCKAVDGQPPLSLRAGTTHTLLLQARDKYGNECKVLSSLSLSLSLFALNSQVRQ